MSNLYFTKRKITYWRMEKKESSYEVIMNFCIVEFNLVYNLVKYK